MGQQRKRWLKQVLKNIRKRKKKCGKKSKKGKTVARWKRMDEPLHPSSCTKQNQ
jgi:hypothetical protein